MDILLEWKAEDWTALCASEKAVKMNSMHIKQGGSIAINGDI